MGLRCLQGNNKTTHREYFRDLVDSRMGLSFGTARIVQVLSCTASIRNFANLQPPAPTRNPNLLETITQGPLKRQTSPTPSFVFRVPFVRGVWGLRFIGLVFAAFRICLSLRLGRQVLARPAALLVSKSSHALHLSDASGSIFKVYYTGPKPSTPKAAGWRISLCRNPEPYSLGVWRYIIL